MCWRNGIGSGLGLSFLAPTVGHGDVSSRKIELESVLSSLDRRVITRSTSPTRPTRRHSTILLSLDRSVVTRRKAFYRSRSTRSAQSLGSICAVAWLDLSWSLARSLYSAQIDLSLLLRSLSPRGVDVSIQQQGLAEASPFLTYPSWLHDESSRKQLARALAVTRIDLSRSLGADRSRAVTWLDLSRSLARSPHSTDESSLDRFIVTWPRSHHSIDESSLDRRVLTRPTSPHSTDESSLDRRVFTRPTSRHSTDESSLDRRSVLSQSLDSICVVAWLDLSRSLARSLYSAQIDFSQSLISLSPRGVDLARALAVTQLDLSRSLGADRSRAVTWLDLSRSLACTPYSAQNDLSHSLRSLSPRRVDMSFCRHPIDESSLDRQVLTRPTSHHSTVLSSPDRRVITRSTGRHLTDESHHSIDESSLDRRVLTRPTSLHSTDESSLDRRVLTRPTSPHSTDESSLDRFVVTRPFCRHSAQSVLSQSLDSICVVAWLDLSRSLARSLYSAQIDLSQSLRSLSPRGVDLARALAVTQLDLSRSLGAYRSRAVTWLDLSRSLACTPYSAQNDLSHSLRSLSPRRVDMSFCRHPIDESSLDRRVLTRPTRCHSTVLSSPDRRVITRSTGRHSTEESSLDRRVVTGRFVVTRPFGRHSIDESSLDRRVLTRETSRHSTVLSSLDRSVVTRRRAFSRLDLRSRLARSLVVTRLAPLRSLDLFFAVTRLALSQSLGSDRSLAVTQIVRKSRA
ncbi:hypothetical protein F2Q69_00020742 [Brassica cretica]|uniref:Uncharacterized protein n=1 Tax=Brassica cretica TaxID=69181 RepID=A0A8S9QBL9_BRACR|nr:hypothetical protein F2Q69_00020742 [Brassica cretica]